MTSVSFEDIYSRFYLRVADYDILSLEQKIVNEMLYSYLRSTLSKPMVRRLFSSIAIDEDNEVITYEMTEPLDDESDSDFVMEVFAMGMTIEWANPRYQSTLLTSQMFSNKEQSFYSQAAHIAQMKELVEKTQTDLRKFIRDRGYSLSVMNGVEE